MPINIRPFAIFHRRRNGSTKKNNKKDPTTTRKASSSSSAATSSNTNAPSNAPHMGLMKRINTRLTLKQSFESDDDLSLSSHTCTTLDEGSTASHSGWFHRRGGHQHQNRVQIVEVRTSDEDGAPSFADQFEKLALSCSTTVTSGDKIALTIYNFVEASTRHEIYALRDLLANEDMSFQQVTLVDTQTCATNMRRWRFKKDNIFHHIRNLCEHRKIALAFQGTAVVHVDDIDMPNKNHAAAVNTAVGVLHEIEKDPDITRLEVTGHVDGQQAAAIMQALTSLLSHSEEDGRTWRAVKLQLAFGGQNPMEYKRWYQTLETYKHLFGQLAMQYGIPITVL